MKKKIEAVLKDDLIRSLLLFFFENQTVVDTAEGIATLTGSEVQEVKGALAKLVELEVLVKDCDCGQEVYCYTIEKKTMKSIESFMQNV